MPAIKQSRSTPNRAAAPTPAPAALSEGKSELFADRAADMPGSGATERSLRAVSQRLEFAMAAAQMGEWQWDAKSDSLELTGTAAAIVGIPSGSRVSRAALRALLHPDDEERTRQSVGKAMADRADYAVECRLQQPSGIYAWVAVRGRAMFDAEGELIAVIGVLQEITGRKRAEEKQRAQEAQLRVLSAHAPAILSHWNRESRLLFATNAFAERWKATPESLVGRTVAEVLGQQAWETVRSYVERVLAGESVKFEVEVPYDGIGRRYMQVAYSPEFGADGEVKGYFSAVTDISERRRAELGLQASEERLRLATQTGKVGVWDWDIVKNQIAWTDSLYLIHGVSRAEFAATVESFAELVHPEDRAHVEESIQRCIASPGQPYELEFRAVRPDGETVWLFTNAVVLREGDRPVRMVGATFDVTARKRAEKALRESEEKFRALARHAPVGIFMTQNGLGCVFVNEGWSALTGFSAAEAAGDGWIGALHPDDRARVVTEWNAAAAQARPFAAEYRFLRRDGHVAWVQGSAVEVRDEAGVAGGFIGTAVDITERKTAEFSLREGEKRFRTLASRAPVGIFMTSPKGETVFVNESWCAMAGLSAAEAQGRGWIRAVHPDDRAGLQAGWDEAVTGGAPSTAEFRFLRADGSVAWVQGSAVQLRDPGGRLTGYVGTVADFTARKLAEDKLREQEAQLRLITTNAPIILAHCDRESRYLFVNRAYADRFNRRPEDFIGRTIAEALGAAAFDVIAPYVRRVLAGESITYEAEIPYEPTGSRYMRVSYVPNVEADGSIRGWLSSVSDLTDRRRAEQTAQFLGQLGHELATLSDPQDIVQRAARLAGGHLGVARCGFVENESGSEKVRVLPGWQRDAVPSLAGEYRMADFGAPAGWQRLASDKVALDDLASHPLTRDFAGNYGALGVRALAAAPFLREGKWMAVLVVTSDAPRRWREDELALLENVVTRVWPLVERARAEEKLRGAQKELQAHAHELERKVAERTASLRDAIAQMEEFSYSVSHDLRSPLRAMNAYAEALVADYGPKLDDTAREYLQRIQRSSLRMEKLTHDVLTYSRLARVDMQLVPIDLDRLLRDLIDQYAELQPAAADVEVSGPLLPVLAHESSLGQCIGNLLTNAAKFVKPGQRPRIKVWTQPVAGHVRVWVEDAGIGIPPQYHAALFQVFERVPTRASYEGTGIGLAIVRKAAEKMGGRVGVESDGEHGSRFWVELKKPDHDL